ncbi:MAG: hypothetical protein AAF682_00770 [Planctomycetota bacterium]
MPLPACLLALLLAIAAATPGASAQAAAPEGALAPAGTWVTHGGSPARTRAAATPALRGTPRLSWMFGAGHAIEDEPLVWGARVFLSQRIDDGRRRLTVLDLRDGSVVEDVELATDRPLAPSVWGDLLVLRADRALHAYRVGARGLRRVWEFACGANVGRPLLFRDELYVVCGDDLLRLQVGSDRPDWRSSASHHGRPSLRGDLVLVPGRKSGAFTIDAIDRETGALANRIQLIPAEGGVPPAGEPGDALIAATADNYIAYLDQPFPWRPDAKTRSLVATPQQRGPRDAVRESWLFHEVEVVEVPKGWIGLKGQAAERSWFLNRSKGVVPLASAASHPTLVAGSGAPSRSGGVVYFGGAAVDLESWRVLWRIDGGRIGPVIPARDALLVQRDEQTIELWRVRELVGSSSLAFGSVRPPAELGVRLEGARAVLADGAIEEGDFELQERRQALTLRKLRHAGRSKDLTKKPAFPIEDVALLLDAEDRVAFAAGPVTLLRAADALIDAELAKEYAALAVDALPAKDYELVEAIVAEALACGVAEDNSKLKRVRRQLEVHAGKGSAGRREERALEIEARLAALEERPQENLFGLTTALPAEEHDLRAALLRGALMRDPGHASSLGALGTLPPLHRIDLLREVVDEAPDHPAIADVVRASLPAGVSATEPFQTRQWLAFLEAIERSPVTISAPKPPGGDLTPEERALGSAAVTWRKDVKAFQSEHLLVITPLSQPGSLARCISVGELVCGALDEMFATGDHVRDQRYLLEIHLFESKKEYLAQSARGGGHSGLEWTAGHYDRGENVSRLFLPADDESFEDVTQTFVHELTHQWVRNRCPLFTNEQAVQRLHRDPTPGFWIVEGFASLLEEFRFDTGAGVWSTDEPNSRRRDVATGATDEQRVPWELVFGLSQADFQRLDRDTALRVPLRTRLGMESHASATSLFYAQSQTACYYLFEAEGGRHREALLAYLGAYYRGDAEQLDVERAFGLSPQALGERALAFARERLQ